MSLRIVGPYMLSLVAIGLAFSPYPNVAWPVACVAFFGAFLSMTTPRRAAFQRGRWFVTATTAVSVGTMALTITVSSWGNFIFLANMAGLFLSLVGRYIFFRSIHQAKLPYVEAVIIVLGLVGIAIGSVYTGGWEPWAWMSPMIIFSFLGFRPTTLRQLAMRKASDRAVAVGAAAPEFTLRSHRDEDVSLSDFLGKRHVMLFFVRGDWCPGCHIMLRAYERNREKFEAKDVAVLAIGADPTHVNREMVDTLELEFGLLSDPDMAVVKHYGVHLEDKDPALPYGGGFPIPTSFLIDREGIVRFTSAGDPGKIVEPEAIFPTLEALPS